MAATFVRGKLDDYLLRTGTLTVNTNATIVGSVSSGYASVSNGIRATTVDLAGSISATDGSFTNTLVTSTITGDEASFTANVYADFASFTSGFEAATGSLSGAVYALDGSFSSLLYGGTATILSLSSDLISVGTISALDYAGNVPAVAATLTSVLTVTSALVASTALVSTSITTAGYLLANKFVQAEALELAAVDSITSLTATTSDMIVITGIDGTLKYSKLVLPDPLTLTLSSGLPIKNQYVIMDAGGLSGTPTSSISIVVSKDGNVADVSLRGSTANLIMDTPYNSVRLYFTSNTGYYGWLLA